MFFAVNNQKATFDICMSLKTELIQTNNKDIVTNKNKKTDEEKREEARLKKQRQRAELKEKYGDEEYKKMRATELAAYLKNKQADWF